LRSSRLSVTSLIGVLELDARSISSREAGRPEEITILVRDAAKRRTGDDAGVFSQLHRFLS